ncbi:MAG: NADH-quinone oxidoreductase subunit L [Prevotellaceae bacterium]|jgi:NADH-quinone oxidoreductase subunit L|nr:NADH-quinone oxidoreductase subunit L [Prevotellaceae bacterium]
MQSYIIIISILILALPLLNFLVLGLADSRFSHKTAGTIGTFGLSIVAILSYITAFNYFFDFGKIDGVYQKFTQSVEWLRFSDTLHIDLGILLDPISVMMLVVISTVSLMVHIYSLGYMKGERGFQRYYAFLSLFTFSMLGLVVATNIFQMYIFWELVGVSSFLLIGFYYTKPSAVKAAKKAFIVTRFADLGFLIGILILSYFTNTFDFGALTDPNGSIIGNPASATFMGFSVLSWATLLIFMGGAGKSAMLPLHIWLPDAMEGPTPVSALIHAATMVVAGVYLVARLFPLYFFVTPDVLTVVAYIGAATSLFAAVVACTQTDIKRVLAFSTISQIAYMMVALGVSGFGGHDGLGYMSSMFHLFTHAFFKALLFLGAGAVIHAVHSNEMGDMGGLRKYLPITHITFLIACLSIAGIPPFSGFFSKDEILVAAFHHDKILFACQYLVAGLTAFYMFRLYFGIFWGKETHYHHTPHEGGVAMSAPLIFLGLLTLVTGFVPFHDLITTNGVSFAAHIDWAIAIPSILVGVAGIAVATVMYKKPSDIPNKVATAFNGFYVATKNKFYFDEIYLFVTKKIIFNCISTPIAWFDRHIVDGFMDFQAFWSNMLSSNIRYLQSGRVQQYVWVFTASAIVIAALVIF